MQDFWSATTGSFVKGYYDDCRSVILFNMSVCTISNPKLYKIKIYNLDGTLREIVYYYKKDAKLLIQEWSSSYPLYYDFYEAVNIDLNHEFLKTGLFQKMRDLRSKSGQSSPKRSVPNISLPTRGAVSLNNTPRSRQITPRGTVSLTTTPRTLD